MALIRNCVALSSSRINLVITCTFIAMFLSLSAIVSAGRAIEPTELEAFFDEMVNHQLETFHIPGAVVAVVEDGEALITKGYGYADLEKQVPVSPTNTLFRIGSTSKLFTWTAVMQLVEANKLDLNTDINSYLTDFQVPTKYGQPITMNHLMSHTAGFEEKIIGVFAHSTEDLRPLAEILVDKMPRRVREPGSLPAYSNYGVALAGHIIAQVADVSWEEYVEEHILNPLGMQHTTLRQPVPNNLSANLAVGYTYTGGAFRPAGFEYVPLAPAGSLSSTGEDMARFMIAHLQKGSFGDSRILRDDTATLMHSQSFSVNPAVSGMAHGFLESSINGYRLIGHGGDTLLFHTGLELLPEQNVGLFVSYNSMGGSMARQELIEAFMDRFFPDSAGESGLASAVEAELPEARQWAGVYLPTRTGQSDLSKIMAPLTAIPIGVDKDGRTLVSRGPDGAILKAEQVAPGVFQSTDGTYKMAFHKDKQGLEALSLGHVLAFEKAKWYQTPNFSLGLLGFSVLLFLGVTLGAVRRLWRQRKRSALVRVWDLPRAAQLISVVVSVLYVFFVVAFVGTLADFLQLTFGVPLLLKAGLIASTLGALLSVVMVWAAVFAWARRYWSFAGRAGYTVVTLTSLVFAWWLNYWNLVGFRF